MEKVLVERGECVSGVLHLRHGGSSKEGVWGGGKWKRLVLGPLLMRLRGD